MAIIDILKSVFTNSTNEVSASELSTRTLFEQTVFRAVYDEIEAAWIWVDGQGRLWINALIDDSSFDHILLNNASHEHLVWLYEQQINGFVEV